LLPGHGAEHLVQACQRTQHKVRRKPIVITCTSHQPVSLHGLDISIYVNPR
jgi:hypothetical protein